MGPIYIHLHEKGKGVEAGKKRMPAPISSREKIFNYGLWDTVQTPGRDIPCAGGLAPWLDFGASLPVAGDDPDLRAAVVVRFCVW
jgi:hypothetical protein